MQLSEPYYESNPQKINEKQLSHFLEEDYNI